MINRAASFRPSPLAPPALIFDHYARQIKQEQGIDVFWQEYLKTDHVLSAEEQQAKDEYTLAKARTAKAELRETGLSDAARFGNCKRVGCRNRKALRLLLRGFCPKCRGVSSKQKIAAGGRFDAAKLHMIDATAEQLKISLIVRHKAPHPDTKRNTTEERMMKVLAARDQNPDATIREIAKQTQIKRSTVSDILQKMKTGAEKRPKSKRAESILLADRKTGAGPAAGEEKQTYVIAETGQAPVVCPRCSRTVIPTFHPVASDGCLRRRRA